MNWYVKQTKLAQAIMQMQDAIQYVSQYADQITQGLSSTKNDPEVKQHWLNYNLNKLFGRCDQTAKAVLRSLQMRNIPSAAAQAEEGLSILRQICAMINCLTAPVFNQITERFHRVLEIINKL